MPHLITTKECPTAWLLKRAEEWRVQLEKAKQAQTGGEPAAAPLSALRGRTLCLLFYEPSTRTRVAFEQAGLKLGLNVITLLADTSSVQKGESLRDTVQTLCAEGIEALVIRHPEAGAAHIAAQAASVPVINAGDGTNEHPTQALLDLFTMIRHKGNLRGRKIAIVGDIRHSRVARSNLWLLEPTGAEVWLCAPPSLLFPTPLSNAKQTSSLQEALQNADIVMVLRLQKERMAEGLLPSLESYARDYQINANTLQWAKPDCIVMHPGPMNRGIEITDEVADGAQSVILEQVRNGLYIRLAVLEYAMGGMETE